MKGTGRLPIFMIDGVKDMMTCFVRCMNCRYFKPMINHDIPRQPTTTNKKARCKKVQYLDLELIIEIFYIQYSADNVTCWERRFVICLRFLFCFIFIFYFLELECASSSCDYSLFGIRKYIISLTNLRMRVVVVVEVVVVV
jgi:hypothetical protein